MRETLEQDKPAMPSVPDVGRLLRLDGRVALVTGAGRGIGAGIARFLGAAGAQVHLVSRTRSELSVVAQGIRDGGGHAEVHVCDVTDSAAVQALVASIPVPDVVVNNAGTNHPEPFTDVSDAHLDEMLNLNTRAVFVLSQAVVRRMVAEPAHHGDGRSLIHISSQMGHVGSPNRSVYCMTKHAVEGLTKAMAVELAPVGIRVNSIGPTFVDTPLVRRIVDTPAKRDFVLSRIPMGRLASIDDIAAAALYLASAASAMVTGTCLEVDGGWTAW